MTRSNEFVTLDSGNRQEFSTGSLRDTDDGKPDYSLISTHGLTRLAHLMTRGAKKYGKHNWAKGQPVSRFLASAFRHLMQYMMGDRTEDHLAAVAFNVFGIIHVEEENKAGKVGFQELLDLDIYQTPYIVKSDMLSLDEMVVYILDHWKEYMDGPASQDGVIVGEIRRGIVKHFNVFPSTGEIESTLYWLEKTDGRLIVNVSPTNKQKFYSLTPF